jgi:hypothetical protein
VRTNGVGNNLTIESGVISSANDSDRDTIRLDGVEAQGISSINTGASADFVSIKRSTLGYEADGGLASQSTMITTGAGADLIRMGSDANDLNAVGVRGNLIINTGADSQDEIDTVQLRDVDVDATIFADLGGGADQLEMLRVVARKNIEINAQKGNDKAVLNDVHAFDKFFANMGEGNDTLDMTFVRANNRLEANGGLGTDELRFGQMQSFVKNGWEKINGKLQPGAFVVDAPRVDVGPARR